MGLFKDWGITNIDLRRKVARKISKKNKLKKRSESADYTVRKYDDYVEFVKNNHEFIRDIILKIKEDEVTLQPYLLQL